MNKHLSPYLMLNGNAADAISFYSDVFNAHIESIELYKDWPQEMDGDIPVGYGDKIMHAHLVIGSSDIMIADTYPGQAYILGSAITLMVSLGEVGEANILFEKLSDGGEVIIPFESTSFSPGYAQVKDKFGIEWQIVTDSSEMND